VENKASLVRQLQQVN